MKKNKVPFFNLSLNFQELPWKHRLVNTLSGILGIIDDLVMILTFSIVMPNLRFQWLLFRLKKQPVTNSNK
jgi:hypothetical protein